MHEFSKLNDRCQRDRGILKRQELPLNPILVIELFDVLGINFIGPFVSSHGMKYILGAVEYVSKWVKAIELSNNEGNSVTIIFKKTIFSRLAHLGPLLVMVDLTF